MELSLVIPVWNDAAGLNRLLRQVAELKLFKQIIVVDDASDFVLGPDSVPESIALSEQILWIRNDRQRGAGYSRNVGLDSVTSSHVLFFDSDDLFQESFREIVELAECNPLNDEHSGNSVKKIDQFDFLIYRHDDSRQLDIGERGTFRTDEEIWTSVGLGRDSDGPEMLAMNRKQALRLCRLSAYPWNKIYRTEFLRNERLRCTELMVHNDLELHWNSFIDAESILGCRLTGAIHYVSDGGGRLTNRRSEERLEVFSAFESVLKRIKENRKNGRLEFLPQMMKFSWDLIKWIEQNIDTLHVDELNERAQRFFLQALDRNSMTLLSYADPALARQIVRFVREG